MARIHRANGLLRARAAGIEVAIEPTFAETSVLLLGRLDFFTRARITFDERAKRIVLEPYA